jgi:hypothetical protein
VGIIELDMVLVLDTSENVEEMSDMEEELSEMEEGMSETLERLDNVERLDSDVEKLDPRLDILVITELKLSTFPILSTSPLLSPNIQPTIPNTLKKLHKNILTGSLKILFQITQAQHNAKNPMLK